MNIARAVVCVGIDRTVAAVLLARGWPVLAGIVTIAMIGRQLTPELQGYFFTLASLIAWQALAELGLNQAIVHFASHESARLAWTADGRLEGPEIAQQRLHSLLRFSLGWFAIAGAVLTMVLIPLGLGVLHAGDGSERASASTAWLVLVPLAAANLLATAAFSLLEGCGKVAEVSLGRFTQAASSAIALWAGLASGAGLFSMVIQAGVALLVAAAWLVAFHRGLFHQIWSKRSAAGSGIRWRTEMWPFQWRMAVSWASGVLIFQVFTPMLFASHGAVAAGQMGLGLQVFGALNMLAMGWISAQVPTYGKLISMGRGRQMDRLFWRATLQSSIALALLLTLVLLIVWHLASTASPWALRMPPLVLTVALCGISLANHLISAQASLLRAHRQDPFMPVSLVSAALTLILCVAWIPDHGLFGAVAAYAAATLGVGLIGGGVVFFRKRRSWWLHEQDESSNTTEAAS